MVDQSRLCRSFLLLHQQAAPLLLPNPWDVGSAKTLASLGFPALATTSSGYAATLGRADGAISRTEALEHAETIVAASDLAVSADLENGFVDAVDDVFETYQLAVRAGLAGASIEDFTDRADEIYPAEVATERVRAAAEAAHGGSVHLVLTARCENYLHGRPDLDDTIQRLQRYQEAGADVLYAPGLTDIVDIRTVVESVDLPVNVLAVAGTPPVAELAAAGVKRVSVGGSFAFAALGALTQAARELLDSGTYDYTAAAAVGSAALRTALDG